MNDYNSWKSGDKIVCIEPDPLKKLKKHEIYTVINVYQNYTKNFFVNVTISNLQSGGFFCKRFISVKDFIKKERVKKLNKIKNV